MPTTAKTSPPTTSERCVQCGWTISPHRFEDVWRDGERVPLHRGGCPSGTEQALRQRLERSNGRSVVA
jgi:hypothetical protein